MKENKEDKIEMDKDENKNFVGIDIGKRMLEVCRSIDGKLERFRTHTDAKGVKNLLNWLKPNDVIALEAGNQAFRIARTIKAEVGCAVWVLHPGHLANIYRSLKKTDKEDALKLLRLVQRIPIEELPVVDVPTENIEDVRRLAREQESWKKMGTKAKNSLHNLCTQAGLTTVSQADLKNREHREAVVMDLPERFRQVSFYGGLVPRVDNSGDTVRHGSITKRGPHLLRRAMVRAAWSLVRSNKGGKLAEFYERLSKRIGKKKAIVATARKMLEVQYVMISTGALYDGVDFSDVEKKMISYGILGARRALTKAA